MMEKRRTISELLESINVGLLDMNIMQAMKMLHDTTRSYSDREKEHLNSFADIPFYDEDDEDEDNEDEK
jgi:hypothetical protein